MRTLSSGQFQKLVLDWFAKHGRKHLPWQQNKTPYRIWVSEIMLQQTQVSTVIPYFERFMQKFPDLFSLAQAEEDEVLHLWAGLGYYSRARNLHRAAKMVEETYAGKIPDSLDELQKLPGIGRSTAGAILALAYHQPAPILDGNVKRVLARFKAITDPVNEKSVENKLWEYAAHYTPTKQTAEYTQAMMDLGATVCTRSNLQCQLCPLIKHCSAYQQGIAALLPNKKRKAKLPTKEATFLIIKKGHEVFLCKRASAGIWGGLWSVPEINGKVSPAKIRQFCQQHFKLRVIDCKSYPSFRHTFSHYHLIICPTVVTVKSLSLQIRDDQCHTWYHLQHPLPLGIPKPVQSILQKLV